MLETLSNIKNDLDSTITHLEHLSASMLGYTLFGAIRNSPAEIADVICCLRGIEESIRRLKYASSQINIMHSNAEQADDRCSDGSRPAIWDERGCKLMQIDDEN